MKKEKKIFVYSVILTLALIIWTIYLPFWNTKDWLVDSWVHNMWIAFDVILILFWIFLTISIYKKNKIVNFFSPLLFGMIIADWILTLLMWYYSGYEMLSIRFMVFDLAIIGMVAIQAWFFIKVYKESKDW